MSKLHDLFNVLSLFLRQRHQPDIDEKLGTLLKSEQITGTLPPLPLPTLCILALFMELLF